MLNVVLSLYFSQAWQGHFIAGPTFAGRLQNRGWLGRVLLLAKEFLHVGIVGELVPPRNVELVH